MKFDSCMRIQVVAACFVTCLTFTATSATITADYNIASGTLNKSALLNIGRGWVGPITDANWFSSFYGNLTSIGMEEYRLDWLTSDRTFHVVSRNASGQLTYDFSRLDAVILPMLDRGICPVMCMQMEWVAALGIGGAGNAYPANLEDFRAVIEAFVEHYGIASGDLQPQHAEDFIVKLQKNRLEWFQDQRYGMFIHWGPSVIHGGKYSSSELSWSRSGNPPDAWHTGGPISETIYDDSFRSFDPIAYDPAQWVRVAQDAGMRYMVLTARHHDGFSMFDTQHSDFKITHPDGAYRKRIARENPHLSQAEINRKADILRQFADAVQAAGLGLGIYYSEPDWLRDDYRIALTGKNNAGEEVSEEQRQAAKDSYLDFMHAQLEELTTQYGRVDILWFDAIKPSQVAEHGWDALWIRRDTWDMIRRNQPGILINDRHGFEPDYHTPEGSDAVYIPGIVQESCQHVGRQWAWWPDDRVPSVKWIIDRVVINASRNSNVLMNLGPSPTGVFDAQQAEQLRKAGTWFKEHAAAIYGTRGGPQFTAGRNPPFVTTAKDNLLYIHVLHDDRAGKEIRLPGVVIASAYLFGRPEQPLHFRLEDDAAYIQMPEVIDPVNQIIVVHTRKTEPDRNRLLLHGA